jgi:hypothetical protein
MERSVCAPLGLGVYDSRNLELYIILCLGPLTKSQRE